MRPVRIIHLILALSLVACQAEPLEERQKDFNFNWKFSLGDLKGAEQPGYDDSGWRDLRLPHDWSVEASFDSIGGDGATGYLPGGIGWYRKHFKVKAGADRIYYLHFDGIYNNADIWLNGVKLGFHPYGYSPFYYDITPHLDWNGGNNVLAVRVDRTRYVDSRWYTGSGIYRNVELIETGKLHIPVWGTFITTPEVSGEKAVIRMQTTIRNTYEETREFELLTEILDPAGYEAASLLENLSIKGQDEVTVTRFIPVKDPDLWDVDDPSLYLAASTIFVDGEIEDAYETRFGIRSIEFDPDKGFFLNGKNMKIKGVCLHHDGGLTGAAVPKGVWKRRLEKLREGGCNAIRSAHNPASSEFLDLCDEMGFLVQDEFFDEWDNPKDKRLNTWAKINDEFSLSYTEMYFQEWAEKDLKASMLSHRNHPCIIQWSIGNEIEWTYPRYKHATGFFDMNWTGEYFWSPPPIPPATIKERYEKSPAGEYILAETAQKLADWTRETDSTRPVIANCILPSSSHLTGYGDALDIVGYSYRRVLYDYGPKHYPGKTIMGTENLGQWHEWKAIQEREHISGTFLWTGIDHLGEAHNAWPRKGSNTGLLNLAGFPKPSWHMYRTLWNEKPHVFLYTQTAEKSIFRVDEQGDIVEKVPGSWEKRTWSWHDVNEHWNYSSGEPVIVEIITNCPEVELLLNGESLGIKKLEDFEDRIMKWALPFEAGTLEARAVNGESETNYSVATHGEAAGILLEADRSTLEADGYDVVHLVAQLIDGDGNPLLGRDHLLEFEIEGECRLLGVDNGAVLDTQDLQASKLVTSKGRGLMILQSTRKAGTVVVTAVAGDLRSEPAIISIR